MVSNGERRTKHTLNIAALNVHSLYTQGRLQEIAALVREEHIDVLAVSETWQKQGDPDFQIDGYRFHGKPRESKEKTRGGGVGLFVSESLRFQTRDPTSPLPKGCEMAAISLHLKGQPRIHIVSTYLPPGGPRFQPATFARSFALPRCLFLGDFNALHEDWSTFDDASKNPAIKRGGAIHRYARQTTMSVFGFPNSPTHVTTLGGFSSPDFFIVGSEIAPSILNWEVMEGVGSDHLPIMATLSLATQRERQSKRKKRWEGATLRVDEYQTEIKREMSEWREQHEGKGADLEAVVKNWCERVISACGKTCQSRYLGHKPGVDHMNTEIKTLIRRRNRARKKAQKSRSLAAMNTFRTLQKEVRAAVVKAKKAAHDKFCESFTKENAFKKLKRLTGRPTLPACIHTKDGRTLTDDREIANHTCEFFATVGRGAGSSEQRERDETGEESEERESEECYNAAIAQSEVRAVVEQLKISKAPGPDGICPWVIKHGGKQSHRAS